MLQDALWADADRLDDDPAYREDRGQVRGGVA